MTFRLRLLGGLTLEGPEGQVLGRIAQRRQMALLALLAAAPGGSLRRDRVVAWLWPESGEERARHSLSDTLYVIRDELGEEGIEVRGDELKLVPSVVSSDLAEFRFALERSEPGRAVDLYGGPLLDGVHLGGSEELERWVADERTRLERQAVEAALERAEMFRFEGRLADAERWARRALEIDPLDEASLRRLVRILNERGDRAGAVRAYEKFRRRLESELDAEPAPETRVLVEKIRSRNTRIGPADSHGPMNEPEAREEAPPRQSVGSPSHGAGWGSDRVHGPSRWLAGIVVVVIFVLASVTLGLLAIDDSPSGPDDGSPPTGAGDGQEHPLVLMMDSPHPSRVYDPEIRVRDGTNADVISDILLDLPIRRQKETISPAWHRDEEILGFDPELVIIHYSGFLQGMVSGPRERLRSFLQYFADTDTEFLVYSRRSGDELRGQLEELLAPVEAQHPGFLDRVHAFGLADYNSLKWKNPIVANNLKLEVKQILDLD